MYIYGPVTGQNLKKSHFREPFFSPNFQIIGCPDPPIDF